MVKSYSKKFYDNKTKKTLESAKQIIPLILRLINPKSVVDIGCARGEFLSVFRERGINNILGVEGKWVDKKKLLIPEKDFLSFNLEKSLDTKKKFDLALSLEVAEHLKKSSAKQFVKTLVNLSDIILFSAAIPYQGGTNHINEQWQTYWVNLFKEKDYLPIDCLRKDMWDNKKISFWYAQNMILFVKKEVLYKDKKLKKEYEENKNNSLSIIHPKLYLFIASKYNQIKKMIPLPIRKILRKIN